MMSSFDFKLHVFRSPQFKDIVNDAIKFFAKTPVHALPPPHRFVGTGVYALYYTGDFKPYARIATLNKPDCTQPIYVGKAVPEGRRTARSVTTVGGKLLGRLREHAKSIEAATNLKLEDFLCRFTILTEDEADLIELVEAGLIRNYKPLWNSGISGFGIHAPGSGRGGQKQSEWDILHPGRYYAGQLTGKSIAVGEVLKKVEMFLSQLLLP
jgi:hypothetical protein